MKQTVASLEGEVARSKDYIARAEGQAQGVDAGKAGLLKALD
jgi:hypothetical protein